MSRQPLLKEKSRTNYRTKTTIGIDELFERVSKSMNIKKSEKVPKKIRRIAREISDEALNAFLINNPPQDVREKQSFVIESIEEFTQAEVPINSRNELYRAYLVAAADKLDIDVNDSLLRATKSKELYDYILEKGSEKGGLETFEEVFVGQSRSEAGSTISDVMEGSQESEPGPKERTPTEEVVEEFEEEAEEEEGLTGQQIDQLEQQQGILMTAAPVEEGHGEEEKDALVDEQEIIAPQEAAVGAPPTNLESVPLSSGSGSGPGVQGSATPLTQGQMQAQQQAGQELEQMEQTDIGNLGDFEGFDLDFDADDSIAQGGSAVSSLPAPAPSAGGSTITGSGMTTLTSGQEESTIMGSGMTTLTSGSGQEDSTIMGSESTEPSVGVGQDGQPSAPATRRARSAQRTYPKPIHVDALGLFFYDAFNPQWDTELFKDRLRRFGQIKGIPAGPFYNQSKMIIDKFGPDLLISSLKFGPTDSLQNVFKENHEILQLYFSLQNPHTGTRSKKTEEGAGAGAAASQTVGVPLGELAAFRGLIAGQRQPGFDVRGQAQAGFNQQGQEAPATTAAPTITSDAEADVRVKVPEPEWVTKLRGNGVRIEQRDVWKSNPVYHSSEFIDSMRRARTNVEDTKRPYSLEKATELDQTVQAPTDKAGPIMRMASPGEICQTLYGVNYDF